jgi:hypothetical protein
MKMLTRGTLAMLVGFALVAVSLGTNVAWGGELNLTWEDRSTNETAFEIERKSEPCTGSSPFVLHATVGANVTTYKDTGLPEGATFCYRVAATNPGNKSPYSNSDDGVVQYTVPTAPSNLQVGGL